MNLKIIVISLTAGIFLFAGYLASFKYLKPAPEPRQIACTMEAKQCPDGSYVGRTGPRCEFAECPNVEPSMFDISDWQTYRNEKYGFELRYPPVYSACEFPINEKELFNLIIGRSNSEEYPDPCDAGVYLDGVFLSIFTDSVENIRGKYKSYDKFSEERRLINDLAWSIFRFELGTPLPSGVPETEIPLGKYKFAVLSKGVMLFELDMDPTTSISEKEFDQILSTFKFIR